jgi:predicted RNA-binding protein with TRAM domain
MSKSKGIILQGVDAVTGEPVDIHVSGNALHMTSTIDGTIDVEVGHGKTLEDPATGTITTATTTAAIAAGGSGIVTYVYGYVLTTSNTDANDITIKRGTTPVTPIRNIQSTGDGIAGISRLVTPDGYLFKSGANEAINIVTSAATDIEYELNYWQE